MYNKSYFLPITTQLGIWQTLHVAAVIDLVTGHIDQIRYIDQWNR